MTKITRTPNGVSTDLYNILTKKKMNEIKFILSSFWWLIPFNSSVTLSEFIELIERNYSNANGKTVFALDTLKEYYSTLIGYSTPA